MNGDEGSPHPAPEQHWDSIDADAVCARCGTVNPEGTLLCKTCGNNLRDQRARRVAEGTTLEAESQPKSAWLARAVAVLGLLVLLWVALNVNNILQMLVSVEGRENVKARSYWQGNKAGLYEDLWRGLAEEPVTPAEIDAALAHPVSRSTFAGRYVLVDKNNPSPSNVLGTAIVSRHDEELHFLALLGEDAEVRGLARVDRNNSLTARNSAAVRLGRRTYYLAIGIALKQPDGALECQAQYGDSDVRYVALAYAVD